MNDLIEQEGNLKKGVISWMVHNPVTANLIMVVCLIGGLMMASNIKKEVFPEFSLDMVTVTVPYPGASPEEVEKSIVQVIEENVRGLDGVKEVTAAANEGVGVVTVEMLVGYDIQKLTQDVKTEVDRIVTFPEEAEEPQVTQSSRKRQVLSIVLSADLSEKALRETAEQVRDRLLQEADITQVEISGHREYEISIEVPQDTLRRYNLTLPGIADIISRHALELPGGSMKTANGEIMVRMKERRDWGVEYENIPIVSNSDGTEVLLKDIAVIVDGFEDIDKFTTYNGKPALLVDVYRIGNETPLSVADATRKVISELLDTMPDGLEMIIWNDSSEMYRQRMDLLFRNGLIGLLLVAVLLSIFLEFRLAFWVSMGIPISFLGAMLFLPSFDITINMMTMFAFLVALGIVVDDAIVVGENVYHLHQDGMPFHKASIIGTRQVAIPVIFSVLTNIVAFLPMLFVPGFMGKIYRVFPVIITCIFLMSLVECLLILPSHLSHQKDTENKSMLHKMQNSFSHWFVKCVRNIYGPFLNFVLRNRYLTILCCMIILALTLAFVSLGYISIVAFPSVDSEYARATVVMPYGCDVSETVRAKDIIEAKAREIIAANGGDKLSTGIVSVVNERVGEGSGATSGSHVAKIYILLTAPEVRPLSTAQVSSLWRKATGEITGADYVRFESNVGGPGSGASLSVELSHRSMKTLETASSELAALLKEVESVSDVDDGFTPGKEQIDFTVKKECQALGFTAANIAQQVRSSYYGAQSLRQQRGRNEIKVMVRLPKEERNTLYSLESMIIRSPLTGIEVPLRDVVEVSRGRAYTSINHRDQNRVVTISADVPAENNTVVMNRLKTDLLPSLINKYPGLTYSFEGRQADLADSMEALQTGFLLALFVIYAMLAIPFKSYTQPIIIMTAIPFGIVGAVLGHIIMGYNLSVISMFGIVALAGVVVNDVIVLIDFANTTRRENPDCSCHDAILAAGIQRFRPIMLTTLTTFGGLAPMIFETSRQAKYLIPMALSLGYGILFSTAITLILAPSLYMMVDDMHNFFDKIKSRWNRL